MNKSKVVRIEIPEGIVRVIDNRIYPLKEFFYKTYSFYKSFNCIEKLARDCYLQGVNDGVMIEKKQREKSSRDVNSQNPT